MESVKFNSIIFTLSILSFYASAESYPDDERVAHGTQTQVGQFKSVVSLGFDLKLSQDSGLMSYCSGAIISKHWVMSAVHCFGYHVFFKAFYPNEITSYKITIVAGVNDYEDLAPSRQDRSAGEKNYYIYPDAYDTKSKYPKNKARQFVSTVIDQVDIALLYIQDPFKFNENVGPVLLARSYVMNVITNPSPCYSVGYGKTSETESTTTMNFIEVTAGGKTFCKKAKDDYMDSQSKAFFICSKGSERANICPGDSGGPLICGDGDEGVSIGVASFYSLKSGNNIFSSMKCGESKKGIATYMFPGHAERWVNDVTDSPNFVAFLKKTDYGGANNCKPCLLIFYSVALVLVLFLL